VKINWKAIGGFLKRWAPVVAEAVIAKRMEKKAREAEADKGAE
jgi:hypothetical protein